MAVDMSIEVHGVKFANPIMPGASDLVATVSNCRRIIEAGIGGVITKTYTSIEAPRARMHPSFFILHGRGFEQAGAFMGFSGNWPEHIDIVLERDIPKFKSMCREANVPLIVSWYGPMEVFDGKLKAGITETWVQMAKRVESAGADLQELNFSCPLASTAIRDCPSAGVEISKAVCDTGILAGIKINPTWEPLEELAKGWIKAGVKFITAHNLDTRGLVIDVEEEMPKYAPAIGTYLPGRAFLPWSLSRVARLCKVVDVPVFGVGGVYNFEDALQYILCGVHIVQICSAAYFRGRRIFGEIIEGIKTWMERKGYHDIREFRGKALSKIFPLPDVRSREKYPYVVPPESPYVPIVDEDKCNLCGKCEACVFGVHEVKGNKLEMDESRCEGCGFCISLCPKGALTLVERRNRSKVIWNGKDIMPAPHKENLAGLSGR
jgi:dihydroorotate dehydrogenase/NAD-dependent dihydropyrimidine dehydrogenase PreA subunit